MTQALAPSSISSASAAPARQSLRRIAKSLTSDRLGVWHVVAALMTGGVAGHVSRDHHG